MSCLYLARVITASVFCGTTATALFAQQVADTVYFGGEILTMEDDQPRVEAVAVKDGEILATGALAALAPHMDDDTVAFDLNGRAMVPGFIDSHGHVVLGGLQALAGNLLAPPDGHVEDMAGLVTTLKNWTAENAEAVDRAGIIVGFGYDPAQLAEQRHPTLAELDQVSTEVPVYIVHQSGHIGVTNSKGLEVLGIHAETMPPEGGVIRRDSDGQPNGVLEGNAHFPSLAKLLGQLGPEGFLAFARAGTEMWARYGYTTAQEGRAAASTIDVLKQLSALGELKIDVAVYPDVTVDRDIVTATMSPDYEGRVRVAGGKLTIDGSPQGFTALRDRPYYDPVGSFEPGYLGLAYVSMEALSELVDWAFANNVQLITHANGEGASDRLLAALEDATKKYGPADRRPVLIHGNFLREDQVDKYQRLDVFPSLFPMHTFYWGDWHRDHTVGPVLADNISPTGWMVKRGMKFGTHHDAPVAFPNSLRVLDATVTRRSRSGDIIGPAQRVDVMTALKAMTIWPAYQHFEEDRKGSIAVGKLADFVLLSADPTAVDPETLDTLQVVATIKEDEVIFENSGAVDKTELGPFLGDHHTLEALYQGMRKALE